MNEVVFLISSNPTYNENGYRIGETENSRMLFCNEKSVTTAEYFSAQNADIDMKCILEIYDFEYEGESTVEYNGIRYHVERTYKSKHGLLELHLSDVKEGG